MHEKDRDPAREFAPMLLRRGKEKTASSAAYSRHRGRHHSCFRCDRSPQVLPETHRSGTFLRLLRGGAFPILVSAERAAHHIPTSARSSSSESPRRSVFSYGRPRGIQKIFQ